MEKGEHSMKRKSLRKSALCIVMSAIMLLGTTTITWAKYDNNTVGWIQDIYLNNGSLIREGFWYKNSDGTFPQSTWKQIGGKYYYFDEEGYLLRNTTTPDGYQVDREGVRIEYSSSIQAPRSLNPELQALADASALSRGISLEDNFDYNGTCAESFNPSADYKITLALTGGMVVEEGHYLRSDSMSGKSPKTVKFEEYGTYNIWSPNVKNVSFKSLSVSGAGGSEVISFSWADNNYKYSCDENGKVKWISRNYEIRMINN
ncbi:hypothetical protein RZO55_06405 [Clostridium boliviensis]|uniref:Cell wall-binding protein n=1 Tax=Clostridium boliviensis TaxID=318465 RepID=A0ABU4GHZ4_9CLOT|nr:hypothetical protein [Clostridium boliviensis]MDW2797206.1 hypothetical protein [Clostridium boliviensis]